MQDLRGRTAVITGAASGIGRALAGAFAREGMNVMIADIEAGPLGAAVAELQGAGLRVEGVETDVTSRESVRAAARRAVEAFGKVHLVCNNAGVGTGGRMAEIPERDWPWVFDVNVMGVVHGVETFTPIIREHGEGGHFVNTASMAGLLASPGLTPYSGSKAAVVSLSEAWAPQLATRGIGMSILCPGLVATRFYEGRRNRQAAYGGESELSGLEKPDMAALFRSGVDPRVIAARVVEAVKADELYVFTHPEYRGLLRARFDAILAAMDAADASPALAAQPERELPSWRA
jgi:NAD(P)-dependent dehydrogenase (short-subunit alcohol dehydrogenase family)